MNYGPTSIVEIVDAPAGINLHTGERIFLQDINTLFEAMGLTSERSANWLTMYGVTEHNAIGEYLIPGFPIFSKIFWMRIDAVRLDKEELEALQEECRRMEGVEQHDTRKTFFDIHKLAKRAASMNAELEFGHL